MSDEIGPIRDSANSPWKSQEDLGPRCDRPEIAQWQKWRKVNLYFVTRKLLKNGNWRIVAGSENHMDQHYEVRPAFFGDATFIRQMSEPVWLDNIPQPAGGEASEELKKP